MSGSVLVDFTDSMYDMLSSEDAAESSLYQFSDSNGYEKSSVSTEETASQTGKTEFDLGGISRRAKQLHANRSRIAHRERCEIDCRGRASSRGVLSENG